VLRSEEISQRTEAGELRESDRVGWSEDESRARGKSEDTDRDSDEVRNRDEGQGEDVEVPSIYSHKMNK
jgi:hypothetical protein